MDKNLLYKCTKFEQFDMDARPLVESIGITPYDEEIYPHIPNLIEFDEAKSGYLCSTADKFQENPSAHIVDMEAYSIAKVCKIFGFDFAAYKFVSDDGNADEWKQNHMSGADLFMEVLNCLNKAFISLVFVECSQSLLQNVLECNVSRFKGISDCGCLGLADVLLLSMVHGAVLFS